VKNLEYISFYFMKLTIFHTHTNDILKSQVYFFHYQCIPVYYAAANSDFE